MRSHFIGIGFPKKVSGRNAMQNDAKPVQLCKLSPKNPAGNAARQTGDQPGSGGEWSNTSPACGGADSRVLHVPGAQAAPKNGVQLFPTKHAGCPVGMNNASFHIFQPWTQVFFWGVPVPKQHLRPRNVAIRSRFLSSSQPGEVRPNEAKQSHLCQILIGSHGRTRCL